MDDHLKQVADRVTSAFMNYRIWRIYTEPGDRAKYLEVLRKYNSFFLTGLQAHFLATIIPLYGLYERRPDGISLTRLIEALPSEQLRREMQATLGEAKASGEKSRPSATRCSPIYQTLTSKRSSPRLSFRRITSSG